MKKVNNISDILQTISVLATLKVVVNGKSNVLSFVVSLALTLFKFL